jgi:hypothetical protein
VDGWGWVADRVQQRPQRLRHGVVTSLKQMSGRAARVTLGRVCTTHAQVGVYPHEERSVSLQRDGYLTLKPVRGFGWVSSVGCGLWAVAGGL